MTIKKHLSKKLLPIAIALYCTSSIAYADDISWEGNSGGTGLIIGWDAGINDSAVGASNNTLNLPNGINLTLDNTNNPTSNSAVWAIQNSTAGQINVIGTSGDFFINLTSKGCVVPNGNGNGYGSGNTGNANTAAIVQATTNHLTNIVGNVNMNLHTYGGEAERQATSLARGTVNGYRGTININGTNHLITAFAQGGKAINNDASAFPTMAIARADGLDNSSNSATMNIDGNISINASAIGGTAQSPNYNIYTYAEANGIYNGGYLSSMVINGNVDIVSSAQGGHSTATASDATTILSAYGQACGIANQAPGPLTINGNVNVVTHAIGGFSSELPSVYAQAYSYGIYSVNDGTVELKKDVSVKSTVAPTTTSKAISYSVLSDNATININQDVGNPYTVKLTGDVGALQSGVTIPNSVVNLNLNNPASFLQGNVIARGNGVANFTLGNQSLWQPVYDNRYGSFYDAGAQFYSQDLSTIKTLTLSGGTIDLTFVNEDKDPWDRDPTHLYRTLNIDNLSYTADKTGIQWTALDETTDAPHPVGGGTNGAFLINTDVRNATPANFGDHINITTLAPVTPGENATFGVKVMYDPVVESGSPDGREYFSSTYTPVTVGTGGNNMTLKGIQSEMGVYFCTPVFNQTNEMEYLYFSSYREPDNGGGNNSNNGGSIDLNNTTSLTQAIAKSGTLQYFLPFTDQIGKHLKDIRIPAQRILKPLPKQNITNVPGKTAMSTTSKNTSYTLKNLYLTAQNDSSYQVKKLSNETDTDSAKNNNDKQYLSGGPWIMTYGGDINYDKSLPVDFNYKGIQGGFDKANITDSGVYYTGTAVSYTTASNNFHRGSGDAKAWDLSLYQTWAGNKGHYYDIVARHGRINNKYHLLNDNDEYFGADYSTNFNALSAEYGYKKPLSGGWYIEPQAKITYGRINGADYNTGYVKVKQGNSTYLTGRAGLGIGRELENGTQIYSSLAVIHEFDGKQSINASGLKFTQDYSGTWYEFSLGANAKLGNNSTAYVSLDKYFGGDVSSNWQVNAGCRWNF